MRSNFVAINSIDETADRTRINVHLEKSIEVPPFSEVEAMRLSEKSMKESGYWKEKLYR